MKKDAPFIWSTDCSAAYRLLLELFGENNLHLPRHELKFIIATDASSYAASAVLSQDRDDELITIAFHSQAFNDTQRKSDKELGSGIKHFDFYLQGKQFG